MAETLLELCGRMLKTVGLGRSLCYRECDTQPEPCCRSFGVAPVCQDGSPLDDFCNCVTQGFAADGECGRVATTHAAWVQTLEYRHTVSSDSTSANGERDRQTSETTVELSGPNCGTALVGCQIRWLIPIIETTSIVTTRPDGSVSSSGSVNEKCGVALIGCPHYGAAVLDEGKYIAPSLFAFSREVGQGGGCGFPSDPLNPWFSEWNENVSGGPPGAWRRNYVTEDRDPDTDRLRSRSRYSGRLEYTSTPTEVVIRYRQQITITTFPAAGGSGTWVSTKTFNITARRGWLLDCDGDGGAPMCVDVPTECDPDVIGYRLGRPCGAGLGRPVVIPASFLRTDCGALNVGGECFLFERKSPIITDPQGINAIVASGLVGPWSPRTCCACSTSCPKEILSPNRAAWRNGSRDLVTGQYHHSPPAVAGECCCENGDRFRLVEGFSLREFLDGSGHVTGWERFDFIDGALPGDFIRGFRRDEPDLSFLLQFTQSNGNPFTQPIGDMNGPIGCEWRGPFAGQGQNTNFNFDNPLAAQGTHPRFNNCPRPIDDPDGPVDARPSGGFANIVYRVGGGCDVVTFEGEWARGDDLMNPIDRITAKQVWRITRGVPSGAVTGCTGGCDSVAQPTPPGFTGTPGSLRDLLGGLF